MLKKFGDYQTDIPSKTEEEKEIMAISKEFYEQIISDIEDLIGKDSFKITEMNKIIINSPINVSADDLESLSDLIRALKN